MRMLQLASARDFHRVELRIGNRGSAEWNCSVEWNYRVELNTSRVELNDPFNY